MFRRRDLAGRSGSTLRHRVRAKNLGRDQRRLALLAMSAILIGLAAGALEVLAEQAPGAPLRVDRLPEPLAQLRRAASWLGLGAGWLAWLFPHLTRGRLRDSLLVMGFSVGAVTTLSALAYCAYHNVLGVQMFDPRPGATVVFAVRATGLVMIGLSAVAVTVRLAWPRSEQVDGAEDLLRQRSDPDRVERIERDEAAE